MFAILKEIFLNVAAPSFILTIVMVLNNRLLLQSKWRGLIDVLSLTGIICYFSYRILGEWPFPPQETTHAIGYLTILLSVFLLIGKCSKIQVTSFILIFNIGMYFAIHPIFNRSLFSFILQFTLFNFLFFLFLWKRDPLENALWKNIMFSALFIGLGFLSLYKASTSIAEYFIMFGGIFFVSEVFKIFFKVSAEYKKFISILKPTFLILLIIEFYNYVL